MIVKVRLQTDGPAILSTQDGKTLMTAPSGVVGKRFALGETVAFFKAELIEGVLELGDRVPNEKW